MIRALRKMLFGIGYKERREEPEGANYRDRNRSSLFGCNGTDRARTDDLLRVKRALFQLSYDP